MKSTSYSTIQQELAARGVRSFYHFTDKSNLRSVVESGGLLSWKDCEKNGVVINRPGGGELSRSCDVEAGLGSYVRLSFVESHPMMHVAKKDGRIEDPVVLKVSTEVAGLDGVLFADRNAARVTQGFEHGGWAKMKSCLHFDVFSKSYFDLSEDERPFYQAEILVPNKIPLCYITNIKDVYDGYINPDLLLTPTSIKKQQVQQERIKGRSLLSDLKFGASLNGRELPDSCETAMVEGSEIVFSWEAKEKVAVSIKCVTKVFIRELLDSVKASGEFSISPFEAGTYTIGVRPLILDDGTLLAEDVCEKSYSVKTYKPVQINSLSSDYDFVIRGSKLKICWEASCADEVVLLSDNNVVIDTWRHESKGECNVSIFRPIIFTIEARNEVSKVVKTLSVGLITSPRPTCLVPKVTLVRKKFKSVVPRLSSVEFLKCRVSITGLVPLMRQSFMPHHDFHVKPVTVVELFEYDTSMVRRLINGVTGAANLFKRMLRKLY